jgi:hypothetical protein
VGINTTGAAPDNSAILDVSATDKGILIPRVALTDALDVITVPSAANGLLIYNTATAGTAPNNVTPGFYFWDGSVWSRLVNDNGNITADNGLTKTGNNIQLGGTLTQATDIAQGGNNFRFTGSGSVGIGTTGAPSHKLHVNGGVRAEASFISNDGTAATPAFRFNAQNGVGIYRPGSNILAFSTGGAERMRIDASGNVAIASLSTNGIVRTTGGNGTLTSSGGAINLATEVTGTLPVANGGTGVATIPANGVVVGNGTSPVTTVAPGANGNVLLSNGTAWTSGDGSGSFIRNQNAAAQTTANFWISGTGRSNTSFQSPVYTRADAGTVAIRPNTNSATAVQLQNAGGTSVLNVDATNARVGIGSGVTAPAYTLTLGGGGNVFGVDNTATFFARNSGGTYEAYLWPRWSDNVMYMNYGSGGMHIRNNASTTTMFMTNNNLVGIGTTGPGEQLHVTGNIRADGIVYWGNSLVRTETRDNAGLQGNAGARSGFFETSAPSPAANWYPGANNWQH